MAKECAEGVDAHAGAVRHVAPYYIAIAGLSRGTMKRRDFFMVTGLAAIAGAAVTLPRALRGGSATVTAVSSGPRLKIGEPGTYRISGRVRLDAPQVEISGITHAQQISWSGIDGSERPTASFSTFEHFDAPGLTRTIRVRGGRLESVTAVPVVLG